MPTQDAASVNTDTWSRYAQDSARNIPLGLRKLDQGTMNPCFAFRK